MSMKTHMEDKIYDIYYLDDADGCVTEVKEQLSKHGPWVVEGHWLVEKALQTFQKRKFDLYLIDWLLRRRQPDNAIDGDKVLEKLRGMKTFEQTSPVVIMSEIYQEDDVKRQGGGNRPWVRLWSYYALPRQRNIKALSNALLDIINHHRTTHPTEPPRKRR